MIATYASAAVGCLAIGFTLTVSVLPEKRFLTVYDMRVVGDTVYAERSINVPYVVADWSVVVVPFDVESPSCKTIPGREVHEGWSPYRSSTRKEMAFKIDEWIWDHGCYERLGDGGHEMFVTWSPRDGSPPVTAYTTFTKP